MNCKKAPTNDIINEMTVRKAPTNNVTSKMIVRKALTTNPNPNSNPILTSNPAMQKMSTSPRTIKQNSNEQQK